MSKCVDLEELEGIFTFKSNSFEDSRGTFRKLISSDYSLLDRKPFTFTTVAVSTNRLAGTVRGLHFQLAGGEETKIVSCLKGEIIDFVLDLRTSSPTFGKWAKVVINDHNLLSLVIPPFFAHGFQTTVNDTEVSYLIQGDYKPELARVISFFDAELGLELTYPITEISSRDKLGISFKEAKSILGKPH
jgi:dTDP-4-dehydrorhamnose 3,5-epimerase